MCTRIQIPFIPLCHTRDQFYLHGSLFFCVCNIETLGGAWGGAKLDIHAVFNIPFLLAAQLRLVPNHVPSYYGYKDLGTKLLVCKHCMLITLLWS